MTKVVETNHGKSWTAATQEALRRTSDLARRVLKARTCFLCSVPADRDFLVAESGEPLGGECLSAARTLWCKVSSSDATVVWPGRPAPDDLAKADTTAIGTFLGVPVRLASGLVVGVLGAHDAASREWSAEDLELAADLAACLAAPLDEGLSGVRSDVANDALRAAEARFLAVADNIPGLVFERRKVGQTQCLYTFYGHQKTQLPTVQAMMEIGLSEDLAFVHPDDREDVRAALIRNTIEETDLDLTFRVREADGAERWLRSRSVVRRDKDGAVFWDGLVFDISDLVAAREDAEAARLEKDAAIVNINHELRTPLQAIIGFSEFLATETRPGVVAAHARSIRGAADALLSIVNQLLEAAGAEAAPARLETIDLRAFAETCLGMVEPQAVDKALTARLELEPDVPESVVIDRQRLYQALLNLLNNAVKFTDDGFFVLRIGRAGDGLRFSVADTGIGIPAEKRDLLFQRFSRIEPEGRATDGSGLGLSITKSLVESMGRADRRRRQSASRLDLLVRGPCRLSGR